LTEQVWDEEDIQQHRLIELVEGEQLLVATPNRQRPRQVVVAFTTIIRKRPFVPAKRRKRPLNVAQQHV
jgi:hypothetical protein